MERFIAKIDIFKFPKTFVVNGQRRDEVETAHTIRDAITYNVSTEDTPTTATPRRIRLPLHSSLEEYALSLISCLHLNRGVKRLRE